jgi:hypothetical protein
MALELRRSKLPWGYKWGERELFSGRVCKKLRSAEVTYF